MLERGDGIRSMLSSHKCKFVQTSEANLDP